MFSVQTCPVLSYPVPSCAVLFCSVLSSPLLSSPLPSCPVLAEACSGATINLDICSRAVYLQDKKDYWYQCITKNIRCLSARWRTRSKKKTHRIERHNNWAYVSLHDSFLPESARWLLVSGRVKDAETVLKNIARVNKKEISLEAFALLTNSPQEPAQKVADFRDLFRTKVMVHRTTVCWFTW